VEEDSTIVMVEVNTNSSIPNLNRVIIQPRMLNLEVNLVVKPSKLIDLSVRSVER